MKLKSILLWWGPTRTAHRTTGMGGTPQFHCRTRLSQQFEVANDTSRYASFMKHQYLGLRISISDPFCFYELNNLFVNCERYNVARKPSQNTLLRIAMFNGLAFPLLFFWVPRWVDIYSIPCVFFGVLIDDIGNI